MPCKPAQTIPSAYPPPASHLLQQRLLHCSEQQQPVKCATSWKEGTPPQHLPKHTSNAGHERGPLKHMWHFNGNSASSACQHDTEVAEKNRHTFSAASSSCFREAASASACRACAFSSISRMSLNLRESSAGMSETFSTKLRR